MLVVSFLFGGSAIKKPSAEPAEGVIDCFSSSFDSFVGFGTLYQQVAAVSQGRSLRRS
jgi:hypothetical protein